MKEKPILFKGDMVNAILNDRKTQTRRVEKNPERLNGLMLSGEEPDWCPYGKPGDRLWVRETHYQYGHWRKNGISLGGKQKWEFASDRSIGARYMDIPPIYIRENKFRNWGWYKRPSIFMPRWASRIDLEITDVRLERVQDISEEDAYREGVIPTVADEPKYTHRYRWPFVLLWDSINAKRGYSWESNPMVWVVEFKRVKP